MKDLEKSKIIFLSRLKKYPTNKVAQAFSNLERKCCDINGEKLYEIEYKISKFQNQKLYMKPWLLPEIIYYSTANNDYRRDEVTNKIVLELYGLYQNYDMDRESEFLQNKLKDSNKSILNYLLYGISQQQFIYQKPHRYINRFSRNYYLLKNAEIDGIHLEDLVKDKFEISLKEYIDNLVLISVISMKHIILNSPNVLTVVTNQEAYIKVIDYLSIDYYDCRNSKLEVDVFKTKPILYTQKGEYIVPSFCLMMYNLGDNLYWLFKDSFLGTTKFVVKFGDIFENYVYEILRKTFGGIVIKITREKNKKSADFYFESKKFIYIVEVKSGVAKLDSKTVTLNKKSFDDFIKNNVTDALEQIDNSAANHKNKTIIPIVVNFDLLYVEDALLSGIKDLYNPENYDVKHSILLGIDDLENLLFSYKNIDDLDRLIKQSIDNGKEFGLQVYKLLEKIDGHKDYFYEDLFNIDKTMLNDV